MSSSEPVYTPAVIKQVGVGSVALANLLPALQAKLNATGVLSGNRAIEQPTTYLIEGQLDKLSPGDMSRMASANQNAAAHFDDNLRELDRLAASLSDAVVNISAYQSLPDGSKNFLADWNQELRTTAAGITNIRKALAHIRPFFNDFRSLLRAAYNTARLRSFVQFSKVRSRLIAALKSWPLDSVTAAARKPEEAAKLKLDNFVNNNREAQAIVNKVNVGYPHGWLAKEFHGSA